VSLPVLRFPQHLRRGYFFAFIAWFLPCDVSAASDPFIESVKFALTGWQENPYVTVEDVPNCVVRVVDVTDHRISEVFRLNNVEVSKLKIQAGQEEHADAWFSVVYVTLIGLQPVHETHVVRQDGREQTKMSTHYKYTVGTWDYRRVVRAWKYIYAHGCSSASSAVSQ
jgi:hypothetical protein